MPPLAEQFMPRGALGSLRLKCVCAEGQTHLYILLSASLNLALKCGLEVGEELGVGNAPKSRPEMLPCSPSLCLELQRATAVEPPSFPAEAGGKMGVPS